MENFSSLFLRLKKERGLSNKQIASFTGAELKEVKKWDAGTSFPTDKKVTVIAITIHKIPKKLPCLEVSGDERPLNANINKTPDTK